MSVAKPDAGEKNRFSSENGENLGGNLEKNQDFPLRRLSNTPPGGGGGLENLRE